MWRGTHNVLPTSNSMRVFVHPFDSVTLAISTLFWLPFSVRKRSKHVVDVVVVVVGMRWSAAHCTHCVAGVDQRARQAPGVHRSPAVVLCCVELVELNQQNESCFSKMTV